MKILQINNCHYRRGGADVVYLNTTQLLLKNGHEVINFSQQTSNKVNFDSKEYFIDQIDYFKLSTIEKLIKTPRFFYSVEAKQKLENLLKIERPDIAHIHTYKGTLTASILIPLKKYNIPVVITLHDYGLLCPHNSFIDGNGNVCEKCLITNNPLNCILNKCNHNDLILSTVTTFEFIFHKTRFPFSQYFDRLIAVSQFGLKMHLRSNKFKDRVTYLYNFQPGLNQTNPNNQKGKYFLYYGRISAEKGIITLLKALKSVNINITLKIAGDGPLMSEISSLAKQNEFSAIEILGFKSGEDLENLINNSSFVIVPSECYENNPLTIIEAYSNGKPVIASKTGGIPEIVIDKKTGFLFEMGNVDLLAQCLIKATEMSQEEYLQFSKNAREFAEENFSEDIHYHGLMDIYNKLTIKRP